METQHHINVVRGWIDANIEDGTDTLQDVLAKNSLIAHEGQHWMCAITDLDGLFEHYLALLDDLEGEDAPDDLKNRVLALSDYWQLVSTD